VLFFFFPLSFVYLAELISGVAKWRGGPRLFVSPKMMQKLSAQDIKQIGVAVLYGS
jgi:hypothetical protein